MPVGTKATVKALHPDEVRALGAAVILGNTYHLHFRPGEDVIEELGGLHAFSGWDGPILTDSGGFQVFSLRDTLLASTTTASPSARSTTATPERFTPEGVAEIQRRLGSDIAMCLDICPPAERHGRARGGRQAHPLWAERQIDAPRAPGQLRFGIAQGGTDPELRRRSIEEIVSLGFDGNALGGLAVGESREEMLDDRRLGRAAPARRASRATSWASATPRESSASSRAASTCSTASSRPGPRVPARR